MVRSQPCFPPAMAKRNGDDYFGADEWSRGPPSVRRHYHSDNDAVPERKSATYSYCPREKIMGHCFCTTENSRMGIGSGLMTPGDVIVVPLGCSTPVIPRSEGHTVVSTGLWTTCILTGICMGKQWRTGKEVQGSKEVCATLRSCSCSQSRIISSNDDPSPFHHAEALRPSQFHLPVVPLLVPTNTTRAAAQVAVATIVSIFNTQIPKDNTRIRRSTADAPSQIS
jgi:hypothetical protein